jgi:hypothetical protein
LAEDSESAWTIPVCVRPQGEKKDTCTDLQAGAPSLIAGRGCPAYIHPNSATSYYRFALPEPGFLKLAEAWAQLDVPARLSLLADAWASVRSGQLDAKAMLKILPAFDDDKTRQVVEVVVDILDAMDRMVVDDESRPAFRKFALARLAKRKKALGWRPPPKGDASSDDVLVRVSVLHAMGNIVEDEATIHEADEVSAQWLANPSSVDADIAAVALDLATRKASDARLAALRAAMTNAKSREDRELALKAMFGFEDRAQLERALAFTLTDDVRPNEMRYVTSAVFGRRAARPIGEAWVRSHWEPLTKKLPGRLALPLVRAAAVGCSAKEGDERASFYGARLKSIDGSARGFAGALEAISLCAALREHNATSLRRALLGTK